MLFSLLLLLLAIASFYLHKNAVDEAVQIVMLLVSLCCLMLSFISMLWMFKLAISLMIGMMPTCIRRQAHQPSTCSQLCMSRSNCIHLDG